MDNEQWKKLREFFTKIDFFPTHNFEEMKEYRLKEIGKRKAIEFFQEMKNNGNEPTQSDFDFFEIEFLKNELSLIDEKIKDVSISNKLQLEKYRKHIELLLSEGTESDKQEQSESKNKIGRKKVEVKNAKDYLTFNDMNKAKFIDLLKEKYSNCEPKTMSHLILVLLEKTYLEKVTNKELKESFCEILNVEQSQTNFNRYMSGSSIDESLIKSIEKTVLNLIYDN
ncbi:MAG: hypothetical protein GX140_04810, partial [Bacteroidales bacterium]|nr:hypothetical protein [Bacteroidales bacterium]